MQRRQYAIFPGGPKSEVHDEHERMLWRHGAGGVKKSWPDVSGIERVV